MGFVQDSSFEDTAIVPSLLIDVVSRGADKLKGFVTQDTVTKETWNLHLTSAVTRQTLVRDLSLPVVLYITHMQWH